MPIGLKLGGTNKQKKQGSQYVEKVRRNTYMRFLDKSLIKFNYIKKNLILYYVSMQNIETNWG